MSKKNRAIALALALAVFFAFFLSASFLIHEADHDCTGESCQVCALISTVQDTIKHLAYAVLVCALALALTCVAQKHTFCFVDAPFRSTPIQLKVKLLN